MNVQKTPAPPASVSEAIKRDLRRRGTIKAAAAQLGVSPQTLSTQLSNAEKAYLSDRIAARLASAFGYNVEYLTTGIGELMAAKEPRPLYAMYDGVTQPKNVEERIIVGIRTQIRKLNELGNTYNNLLEHIIELAECITGGPNYDYCQKVINALKDGKVKLDPRINPIYEELFKFDEIDGIELKGTE